MIDISSYFTSLTLLAALATIVSGYVNTHALSNASSTMKQIASWVVAIGLAFVGSLKGLGIVADTSVLFTALNGLAIGLVSNGIFDVSLVQSVLEFIRAKKAKV